MAIERLRVLVEADLHAVNQLISDKIQSQISLIEKVSAHIVQSGGKRLRPLLVLLSSLACNYEGKNHILLAAMVEFFHTATLLHDDVIDESKLRRGHETANEIWGSKASILVGDYLFTQYMQLMITVGNLNIMRLLTDIAYEIGCGEIKQLANRHNIAFSLEEYFEVIRSKTSLLFAACTSVGAMIAEQPMEIEQSLFNYGLHVGNAFQLIDDVLDYSSNKETIGKNIGDDLADGKATMPIIHALQCASESERGKIIHSLEQGSREHLSDIIEILERNQSIQYTRQAAESEVEKALQALNILDDSKYKQALVEFAYYAATRDR